MVGESGCGKTVMIKSLLRLHDKTNAQIAPGSRILFEGRDIGEMNKKELMELRGNEIVMIFQDSQTSLNPTTQVGKQIEEDLLIHKKLPKEACRKRVLGRMGYPPLVNPAKICYIKGYTISVTDIASKEGRTEFERI